MQFIRRLSGSATFFVLAMVWMANALGTIPTAVEAVVSLDGALARTDIVIRADEVYQDLPDVDRTRRSLDVYTRAELRLAPIILFAHGGAWRQGDKRAVGDKPQAFVPAGFVVASVNYRFRPDVSVADMAQDIAQALAWLRAHATSFGGDPDRIVLMGHSAGAHLVAVVGTNPMFLQAAGVPSDSLRGVITLDTGPYHVPRQMQRLSSASGQRTTRYGELMQFVFDLDPDAWEDVSPWHHATSATPPFLIFSSEGRSDAALQAVPFAAHLQALGVEATHIEAIGRTHGTLNTKMGAPGDATTEQVLDFLRRVTR
jgi:acetyl esterase/lipase